MSVEQFQQLVAKTKLQAEHIPEENSPQLNAVTSDCPVTSEVVGPVVYLEIEVEGRPIKAVVDSGA